MQDNDFSWQAMQEVVMSGSNYPGFVDSLSKYNRVCCNCTVHKESNYYKLPGVIKWGVIKHFRLISLLHVRLF